MTEILRRHSFSIAFFTILFGYLLFFTGTDESVVRLQGTTMGTTYSAQLIEPEAGLDVGPLSLQVQTALDELDSQVFSTYSPDSELSRLNRQPVGRPLVVSRQLIEVLLLAEEIRALTDGAFDVTVGPLVNLWGFGPGSDPFNPQVPEQSRIDAARQRLGADSLRIDAERGQVTRNKDTYIDLSAIAKGYAVDQVAALLDNAGIQSYFLEIGGELKIKGLGPGGRSWIPAIETPQDSSPQVYDIFYSRGEEIAVAGSGDYRNYFEKDGVRYSHEIDPRTGYPVTHNLAAAYVIDSSAAKADALATAYMILGLEKSRELASGQSQAVYLIYKEPGGEFDQYISPQFETYLRAET